MKEQRYTWDFNTILNVQKECLEEVKTLQGISSYASKEDVCKLKERIHTLLNISEQCQNMLHLAFPKNKVASFKQSDSLVEDSNLETLLLSNVQDYFETYSSQAQMLLAGLLDHLVGLIPEYLDWYDSFVELSRTCEVHLSNHDLVELAHLFYQDFFPNGTPIIDQFSDWQNHTLLFQYYKDIETAPANGLTFSKLPSQKYPSTIIFRNNSLTDFTTLVHELGHMYMGYQDESIFQKNYSSLLREVEGKLPEFAALSFLQREGLFEEDLFSLQATNLFATLHSVHTLFFQLMTGSCIQNHHLNFKKLERIVNRDMKVPFSYSLLLIYGEYSIFSVAQDIISDFAAYELAERYQTNPEEVSEIFQNLPKLNILPTEDALTQIGCKFHTNHAKGYQKTMKRIQKEFIQK